MLGFFLSNSVTNRSENKYHYSLCLVSKNPDYVKKVCDLLFRIIFNDKKHTPVCYDSSIKIKDFFKSGDHYFPVISTDRDFNKADRKKLSNNLTRYYEKKPKKLKEGLIIISSKEISCQYIYNINLDIDDISEAEKIIIDLKSDTSLTKTVEDFLNNITNQYSDRSIFIYDKDRCEENNKELIKSELSEKEQELSHKYALTFDESVIYTPVIYFLEKYFEFLSMANALTKEQYVFLNTKLPELYSKACNEEINDTFTDNSELTTEEISEILLRCIARAYMAQKIPNTTDNNFYIYTKCKKHNKLICFNHQEDSPLKCVIDLIEEAGMHDKIADIKELARI